LAPATATPAALLRSFKPPTANPSKPPTTAVPAARTIAFILLL
jgi:hypothetical protein